MAAIRDEKFIQEDGLMIRVEPRVVLPESQRTYLDDRG